MICRVCDSLDLVPVIDLGSQPWGNHFLRPEEAGTEPVYPLCVLWCERCHTTQLDYTVSKETMFSDHTYLSGTTASLSEHFRLIAVEVDERFVGDQCPRTVLDIGSNDGTQLQHFRTLGYDVLGVESSKTTAAIAQESGVPTLHAFFNEELVQSLGRRFQVINAAGVFFHLEELHSVTEGIRRALEPGGVFVVQFLYMSRIVENGAFDQIYHEHLLYYNLRTIAWLLERHGLELFDAYLSPIHGGSIVAFVGHPGRRPVSDRLNVMSRKEDETGANDLATYLAFAERINRMKAKNLAFLVAAQEAGKLVYGFGAPVKGNTLLNYFGVGTDLLECLVEKNALRRGLVSPGMHIPIVMEDEVRHPPDIYYVLAWNFKREILANNQGLLEQGVQFHFPVDPKGD